MRYGVGSTLSIRSHGKAQGEPFFCRVLVVVLRRRTHVCFFSEFHPSQVYHEWQYEGSYLSIETPSELTAKIQRNPRSQNKVVHIDKLKEYLGTPHKSWLITSPLTGLTSSSSRLTTESLILMTNRSWVLTTRMSVIARRTQEMVEKWLITVADKALRRHW